MILRRNRLFRAKTFRVFGLVIRFTFLPDHPCTYTKRTGMGRMWLPFALFQSDGPPGKRDIKIVGILLGPFSAAVGWRKKRRGGGVVNPMPTEMFPATLAALLSECVKPDENLMILADELAEDIG